MKKILPWVICCYSAAAWAGGFEYPDNGTEALGRGATFTAKADSPLALEYNIAGLARQRGTNLLVDLNVPFNTYDFTRDGVYPSGPSSSPQPAYVGQRYPTVHNGGSLYAAPFIGLTTDFNKFDRWTFAFGLYGPSAIATRDYPVSVTTANGASAPGPSRYDLLQADLLVLYPTLAAAVRVNKWFDVGLAVHLVVGTFKLSNATFTAIGAGLCPPDFGNCDPVAKLDLTGYTATVSLGAMFRPMRSLQFGLNLRAPFTISADGTVTATPPTSQTKLQIDPAAASFTTHFPLVLRVGARYIFYKNDFELADIEFNGIYEGWGQFTEEGGDQISIPQLGPYTMGVSPFIAHHYKDTFGARLGGAYNLKLPKGVLTFRLGIFYDSAATLKRDPRLDADTMDKIGTTAGLGYKIRGITINAAYAYIWSPDRTVTNGEIRSADANNGGQNVDINGVPLPVVNNGKYHAETQILSVGLTIAWNELLKKQRVIHYQ